MEKYCPIERCDERQVIDLALRLAVFKAGRRSAARIAINAILANSSIKEKFRFHLFHLFLLFYFNFCCT